MKSALVQIGIVMAGMLITGYVLESASRSSNATLAELADTISAGYDTV